MTSQGTDGRLAYEPPAARDATPQEQTLLERLTLFETTARILTDKTCTAHFVSGRSCIYYVEKGHDVEPCPACKLRLMAEEM